MSSRIDLSCVFDSALSPRHAVPHCVLTLRADDPFARYLDSNDTRLPSHPALAVAALPAEEYDTYTGEDDWLNSPSEEDNNNNNNKSDNDDDSESPAASPPPRFDRIVRWVAEAIDAISGGDGVVLCGRRVVADDCPWAVPSRTPALFSPRDVFVAMRSSSKFLCDWQRQRRGGSGGPVGLTVGLTLARALGGRQSQEFRVFVPHRFADADGRAPPVADWAAVGISQRATDVCVPLLMAWDEETHERNFAVVLHHVQHARLMERAAAADAQFLPRLMGALAPRECVAMLAVDIIFDGPSLPVRLLSAKARGFRARDPMGTAPHICEDDRDATRTGNHTGEEDSKDNEEAEDEATLCGADSASFFRLFRDAANWNRYVDVTRTKQRPFFVVASEMSDLITTSETLTKRGMPLELLRPELLQGIMSNNEWHEHLK